MTIETFGERSERAAELLKSLIDSGKLRGFAHMVQEGQPAWLCIAELEEELLRCDRESRSCGSPEEWRIVVGLAEELESVPSYQGWGEVKGWFEKDGVCAAVEPSYGVVLRECEEFDDEHSTVVLASAPFAEDSGSRLNAAFRAVRELEEALEGEG